MDPTAPVSEDDWPLAPQPSRNVALVAVRCLSHSSRSAGLGEDDETLRRLFEPAVVAGETAWPAPNAQASPVAGPPGRAGTCAMGTFAPRRIQARCQATRAGLAVFVEKYERGWRAEVDGRAAPLLRANLVMRGVPVESGKHQIVLEYRATLTIRWCLGRFSPGRPVRRTVLCHELDTEDGA